MTADSLNVCEQVAVQVAYIGGWVEGACAIVSLCAIFAFALYAMRKP